MTANRMCSLKGFWCCSSGAHARLRAKCTVAAQDRGSKAVMLTASSVIHEALLLHTPSGTHCMSTRTPFSSSDASAEDPLATGSQF